MPYLIYLYILSNLIYLWNISIQYIPNLLIITVLLFLFSLNKFLQYNFLLVLIILVRLFLYNLYLFSDSFVLSLIKCLQRVFLFLHLLDKQGHLLYLFLVIYCQSEYAPSTSFSLCTVFQSCVNESELNELFASSVCTR